MTRILQISAVLAMCSLAFSSAHPTSENHYQPEREPHHAVCTPHYPCRHPQIKVIPVHKVFSPSQSHGKVYNPDTVVLHRCDECTGSCLPGHSCAAKFTHRVVLPFKATFHEQMVKHEPSPWIIEYHEFVNHTECACVHDPRGMYNHPASGNGYKGSTGLSSVYQGIQSGPKHGVHSGINQGVHSGIDHGHYSGIDHGVHTSTGHGVHSGINQEVHSGIDHGVHSGIDHGHHSSNGHGVHSGIDYGVHTSTGHGVHRGIDNGVHGGIDHGHHSSNGHGVHTGTGHGVHSGTDYGVHKGTY